MKLFSKGCTMKNVIVNADEFGLTRGINRGIIESFEKGIVRATSIFWGGRDLDYAISYALLNSIDVGVHLNLTFGIPLDKSFAPLNKNGTFFKRRSLLLLSVLKSLNYAVVYKEFETQLLFFLNKGLKISHLDTHQHIHTVSPILEAAADLAKKYDLFLRVPQETILMKKIKNPKALVLLSKKKLIVQKCNKLRTILHKKAVKTTEHFLSPFGLIPRIDIFTPVILMQILKNVSAEGSTEYMAHPGYIDADFGDFSAWAQQREQELSAYTSPLIKEFIRNNDIISTNFL